MTTCASSAWGGSKGARGLMTAVEKSTDQAAARRRVAGGRRRRLRFEFDEPEVTEPDGVAVVLQEDRARCGALGLAGARLGGDQALNVDGDAVVENGELRGGDLVFPLGVERAARKWMS